MSTHPRFDEAFQRALGLLSRCEGISNVERVVHGEVRAIDATIEVNLPSACRARGETPAGVKREETVRFYFPDDYPLGAPYPTLREDFSREVPHMFPQLREGRPIPCIYEGNQAELLHHSGLGGIVEQTCDWLRRAASHSLIDPEQGWEPVRRDVLAKDWVIIDAHHFRRQMAGTRNHQARFFRFSYIKVDDGQSVSFHGEVANQPVRFDHTSISHFFRRMETSRCPNTRYRPSLALVIPPGQRPSGNPAVIGEYLLETVDTTKSLMELADRYSCKDQLGINMRWLQQCFRNHSWSGSLPLAVILAVSRPYNLTGSDSNIELCAYIVHMRLPHLFAEDATVRPAAHRHPITRGLLAQMSGDTIVTPQLHWTLLGAGSLGSKVALHLARTGNAPRIVADQGHLQPHNMARHALTPTSKKAIAEPKAQALCDVFQKFKQTSSPIKEDITQMLATPRSARRLWSKNTLAIINTTASPTVNATLTLMSARLKRPPMIEMFLLASGKIGVILVEGPDQNPSIADLTAEYHALLGEDSDLARVAFADNADSLGKPVEIGEGCSSQTMLMSDGRLSLFAASMSECVLALLRKGLPQDGGQIFIGRLTDDGIGLQWQEHTISPMHTVETEAGGWRAHVNARAMADMQAEIDRWPNMETGGVLLGEMKEVSCTFHVVDILVPPEDSKRSPNEFILGTLQLSEQARLYSERRGGAVYALGTWHSHLIPAGPSERDRKTARELVATGLAPLLFLVKTPARLHAFHADITAD